MAQIGPRAEEITRKLIDRQRTKVRDAEAKLAEERKRLSVLESMTGELKKAIEEAGGLERGRKGRPSSSPTPAIHLPTKVPASTDKIEPVPERSLKTQEITGYVDQFGRGEFTPSKLKAFVETQIHIQVKLAPLQLALARMARVNSGVRLVAKGSRWGESIYTSSAIAGHGGKGEDLS